MLTIAWLLVASTVSLQPDTTVVLGLMERDLFGDSIARSLSALTQHPVRVAVPGRAAFRHAGWR